MHTQHYTPLLAPSYPRTQIAPLMQVRSFSKHMYHAFANLTEPTSEVVETTVPTNESPKTRYERLENRISAYPFSLPGVPPVLSLDCGRRTHDVAYGEREGRSRERNAEPSALVEIPRSDTLDACCPLPHRSVSCSAQHVLISFSRFQLPLQSPTIPIRTSCPACRTSKIQAQQQGGRR